LSKPVIPKEQLTAYQRWEMESLDESSKEPAIALPTAEEIEQIHRNAHQEGYNAGRAQGHEQGYQEGFNQGIAAATEKANQIQAVLSNLNQEMQRMDQEVADDMLSLSLAIAKQVLLQSLEVKPEILLSVIREAIADLPPFNQHANLVLNPLDSALVKEHMGEQLGHTGWKIIEDERVARGGCRLETSASQMDVSLSKRWERVVSAIAQNSAWLSQE
jgi:flagellar assembly protein FliH